MATKIRGPVAIHAAKKPMDEEGKRLAEKYGIVPQYGKVLGIVDLSYCLKITSKETATYLDDGFEIGINKYEREVGWYENGRFAWEMQVLEKFENPVPAKGQQGFWKWDGK